MKKTKVEKKCFLITPIGADDSIDRKRVEQWIKSIYPAALKEKCQIVVAHKITTPGTITKQVIDNILDADLVIIDFTPANNSSGPNPNVMYEAAIRHIAKKPFIQIAPINLHLPFDIKDLRCILYDPYNINYPKKMIKDIKEAISEINDENYEIPEIISYQINLDRIVSDPKKFVEILSEKLFSGKNGLVRFKDDTTTSMINSASYGGATNYYPNENYWSHATTVGSGNYYDDGTSSLFGRRCPSCGGKSDEIMEYGRTSGFGNINRSYKCRNCGIVFNA